MGLEALWIFENDALSLVNVTGLNCLLKPRTVGAAPVRVVLVQSQLFDRPPLRQRSFKLGQLPGAGNALEDLTNYISPPEQSMRAPFDNTECTLS